MTFPNKGFGQRPVKASTVPPRATTKSPVLVEADIAVSTELKQRIYAIKDIRKETRQDRAELLKGPVIAIVVHGKVVDYLPFHLFLAASFKVVNYSPHTDKLHPRSRHPRTSTALP